VLVEHVDVHEVLQVLGQRAAVEPRQLVGALDALGLPVGPVQPVLVQRQAEGVGQLGANQHLANQQVKWRKILNELERVDQMRAVRIIQINLIFRY